MTIKELKRLRNTVSRQIERLGGASMFYSDLDYSAGIWSAQRVAHEVFNKEIERLKSLCGSVKS